MYPVEILTIQLDAFKWHVGQIGVPKADIDSPSRVVQRADSRSILMLPIAITLRRIPSLESLEYTHAAILVANRQGTWGIEDQARLSAT